MRSTTPRSSFLRVGVTGGIGSGKSTVCKLFADLGRFVIAADEIARKLSDESATLKQAIVSEFGTDAYLPDGTLDRPKVASVVFRNAKKRQALDSIVHPHVFAAIDSQLQSLPITTSHPYTLIEAALIYETGMDETLDYVIVVSADEDTCIQRVMERDQISMEDVLLRIAAQMPLDKKVKKADFVIQNNGTVADVRSTVLFLDRILSQLTVTTKP